MGWLAKCRTHRNGQNSTKKLLRLRTGSSGLDLGRLVYTEGPAGNHPIIISIC
ncbi:hypothetical protein AN958_00449 [Leucoagaricus sp. SymC.cos]|nr:hypothetical protein AN958_00449 [Leucoagaricus sp. SymC.cos]